MSSLSLPFLQIILNSNCESDITRQACSNLRPSFHTLWTWATFDTSIHLYLDYLCLCKSSHFTLKVAPAWWPPRSNGQICCLLAGPKLGEAKDREMRKDAKCEGPAMKPWGHQAVWSSPPLKALDRSASLRDSWFGCQACPLTSTRFTWKAATHIRGMDLAIMFGSPWASESGLKASQQCCSAAEATPWIHLSARQKRRATEPSPQHLNIQTLQALSLDVLRLSSLPKKAPKTSNLLSLKPCEVTSTDVIA